MSIQSDNPIVQPSVTFDQWWLTSIRIVADNPNDSVMAQVTFQRLSRDQNGVGILHNSTPVALNIPDLFALAGTNSDVADAITALTTAAVSLARTQGLID